MTFLKAVRHQLGWEGVVIVAAHTRSTQRRNRNAAGRTPPRRVSDDSTALSCAAGVPKSNRLPGKLSYDGHLLRLHASMVLTGDVAQ